jgi:hypothetical protein
MLAGMGWKHACLLEVWRCLALMSPAFSELKCAKASSR